MNLTLAELKEALKARYDPDEVLELLDISTEELIEAFEDKIIGRYTKLNKEIED